MKPLPRRIYALAAIALIVVLFVAVNIVSAFWLRTARVDLTQNGLYTVSAGTKDTLAKLPEPITLRFYFSRESAAGFASIVAYSSRVRDLLQEYTALAGSKLILEEIDPAPFTPAEDEAVAQGLTGAPTQEGENVYFGLVGTNTLAGHEAIPFFDQQREQYLEYDLTSLIDKLSKPQKPKLAVISALPLAAGSGGLAAALQGNSRPFAIYQQLQQNFDLQTLETTVDRIPADVSTLQLKRRAEQRSRQVERQRVEEIDRSAPWNGVDDTTHHDIGLLREEVRFDFDRWAAELENWRG
jgi:ABC-type uncharacterized transport system involved in gliding motility auxiliary subunit